ncbi:MAG TPA: amidase [Chloroflexota bacterium]|nr:amidase [Chloroflexota bacterium]
MADDELCYLTIAEAARLIRTRAIAPVDLVEAMLARIETHDGRVRAFLHVAGDQALPEARTAGRAPAGGEDRGPLHGVPIAIKDIVDVAAMPTTAGSRVLAGNVASEDAALVAALRRAGAIIVGKTNTHEFAYGVITPPTRNPWDLTRIPGGSSGGSAAALSAGMAYGAVGTDTAGSIRLPAALCGVVGLKPTYGRVSRRGIIPLSWSLDHAGPMARSVTDAALLLEAMVAGRDPRDPATAGTPLPNLRGPHASGEALRADVRGLRVGVPRPYFYDGLEPSVAAVVEEALRVLASLGMELREVALPGVELTFALGRAIQRPEASAYHRQRLREVPDLYGDELRGDLELGELFLATDYIHAQRVRAELHTQWLEVMDQLDVLAMPTVPVGAPRSAGTPAQEGTTSGAVKGTLPHFPDVPAGKGRLLHNTYPANLVGFPALSLPCGLTAEGLPVGLQLIGRPFDEATVLRAGHAYEAATAWHTMRPPLEG